jgi:hypothetical protein
MQGAVALVLLISVNCSPDSGKAQGEDDVPLTDIALELRIDGYEADLVPVYWMGVAPSGVIAVGQTQDSQLRFFSEDGTPLGRVGRAGEGPGEFRRISRGGWVGDTLWISDTDLNRVTLIAPDLKAIRVLPLTVARPQGADTARLPTFPFVFPYAVYPGDTVLASVMGVAGDPLAERLKGTVLARVSSEGMVQRLLLQTPVNEGSVRVTFERGFGGIAIPFFARPEWVISPDGSLIAVVTTEISGPEGGTFHVTLHEALEGSVVFRRSFDFVGVPIPSHVIDSVLDSRAAQASRQEFRQVIQGELRGRVPPVYPPVEGILLGSDDRIWVGLRATANGRQWLVLGSQGEPVERVILPTNVEPKVARGEHVWGLETDEMEVQSIVRYRLLRHR